MSVYIHLFHGRRHEEQDMHDWGEDGPVLGPFPYIHTTYASEIKCGDELWLRVRGDCVYFDGWWYGDWSVFGQTEFEEDQFEQRGRWVRRPYGVYGERDPRTELPKRKPKKESIVSRGCDTEAQARERAEEVLAEMTTTGWTVRVWENLGWHFTLEHPSGFSVYEYTDDSGHYYSVHLSPDGGGDEGIWHEVPDEPIRDPNEAVRWKAASVRKCLAPYFACFREVEELVGVSPVPEKQGTSQTLEVYVRVPNDGVISGFVPGVRAISVPLSRLDEGMRVLFSKLLGSTSDRETQLAPNGYYLRNVVYNLREELGYEAGSRLLEVAVPTLDGLLQEFAGILEQVRERARREEERREAVIREMAREVREWIARPPRDRLTAGGGVEHQRMFRYSRERWVEEHPVTAELAPAYRVALAEAEKAAKEVAEERRQADERKHNEKKEKLRRQQQLVEEWITRHGSDHLKALMEEGLEYKKQYLDERVAHELPGWVVDKHPELEHSKLGDPAPEDVALLRRCRKQVEAQGDLYDSPELVYGRLTDADGNLLVWSGALVRVTPSWAEGIWAIYPDPLADGY